MFKILDLYIGKVVFTKMVITLLVLESLSSVIRFIEQLRKIGQGDYSATKASLFTILSIPKDVGMFFPMAALLGAMLGLGFLITQGELTVMQAVGFSRLQIAMSVIKVVLPLSILTIAIDEWISPISEQTAYNYRTKAVYGGSALSTKNGIWIKDQNNFVYIAHLLDKNVLGGINIYHFNKKGQLEFVCYAVSATFCEGIWNLSHIEKLHLINDQLIVHSKDLQVKWKTSLTPDKLGMIALEINQLSISNLYHYIVYLKKTGQEYKRYQVKMWSKIFSPLLVMAMIMVAVSFAFRVLWSTTAGVRIITGISLGIFFYVFEKAMESLGIAYDISSVLVVLVPIITLMIISIAILLRR